VANVQDFVFTSHAIDRYIQRVNPQASYTDAKSQLVQELDAARKQKQNTRKGDNRWLLPNLKCVLITRREAGTNIVLTVVTKDMETEGEVSDAEVYQEWVDEFERLRHFYDPTKTTLEWQDIISRVTSIDKKRCQIQLGELQLKDQAAKQKKLERRIRDQELHIEKLREFVQNKAIQGDVEACYLLGRHTITAQE
jgi:hypothetical protein